MQCLFKGRSPCVLACLRTVVPVDISRVALTDILESTLHLNELLLSLDSTLRGGNLKSMWRQMPQMSVLSESLGSPSSLCIRNLKRSKHLYAQVIRVRLRRLIAKLGSYATSGQGVSFCEKEEGWAPRKDVGIVVRATGCSATLQERS